MPGDQHENHWSRLVQALPRATSFIMSLTSSPKFFLNLLNFSQHSVSTELMLPLFPNTDPVHRNLQRRRSNACTKTPYGAPTFQDNKHVLLPCIHLHWLNQVFIHMFAPHRCKFPPTSIALSTTSTNILSYILTPVELIREPLKSQLPATQYPSLKRAKPTRNTRQPSFHPLAVDGLRKRPSIIFTFQLDNAANFASFPSASSLGQLPRRTDASSQH